jgi:hypothetical protein
MTTFHFEESTMLDFLKTTPQVEMNKITIDPPPSKKDRILAYKTSHPEVSNEDIARATGSSGPYVSMTLGAKNKAPKNPKKGLEISTHKHKTEGFAIGVNQPHYWVISALASGKKTTRTAILQGIIDQYIRDVLTEVSPHGSSV